MISAYVKVLQELGEMKRLSRAPDHVLPLPKEEMLALLQRSAHPSKEKLISLLGMFEAGAAPLFLSRLIVRPAVVTLAYAGTGQRADEISVGARPGSR